MPNALAAAAPALNPLRSAGRWLADALFPPTCLGCGRRGTWCCAACLASLTFPRTLKCPACEKSNDLGAFCQSCQGGRVLNGLWHAQPYGHPLVRTMVRAFKFDGLTELADTLGKLLAATLTTYALPPAWHKVPREHWYLTPVPLHSKRARTRGFNQSVLLADELAASSGLSLRPALTRQQPTAPQSEIKNDGARLQNVAGAFSLVRGAGVAGNAFILVDDVYTSGATMEECAKVLKNAGATEVWGLTVAKG